mmetsp:Transcript_27886/g.31344  ORF Transcript_27886/g.31344 Transcript_27886/m.31344 type:complete len:206 (-) Transcript_27886:155-772(-)
MTLTDKWDPSPTDVYRDDNILLRHGVFDVGDNASIHPNYFNGVLNDSLGRPYTNDDPLTPTQTLHHALLKSSMRYKKGDVEKSIDHYDAVKCKLQLIWIFNATDYFNLDGVESLRLLLSICDLTMFNMTTIESINLELIFAHQIRRSSYGGSVIEEVVVHWQWWTLIFPKNDPNVTDRYVCRYCSLIMEKKDTRNKIVHSKKYYT